MDNNTNPVNKTISSTVSREDSVMADFEKMLLNDVVVKKEEIPKYASFLSTEEALFIKLIKEMDINKLKINYENVNEFYNVLLISFPADILYSVDEYSRKNGRDPTKRQTSLIELVRKALSNDVQHHTTSLSYEGKEPRKDVLIKLKAISEYLESLNCFPLVSLLTIRAAINTVLGGVDKRTTIKYYKSIKTWYKAQTGKNPNYENELDLSDLNSTILKKLE